MSEKFKSIILAGIIAVLVIAVGLNIGHTVETQQRIQMRQDNLTSVNEQLAILYANLQDIENTCSSNRIILGNVVKTDDASGQTVVSDIDTLLLRVSETEADILNFQDFLTSGNAIDSATLEDINNTYDEIGQSMTDIQNLYNNTSEELSSYIDSYMVTSDNTSDDTINKLNDIKKNMNGLTVNTAAEFANITKEEKTVLDTFTDSLNETLDSALSVINKNSTQTKTNLTNGYNQTQSNINNNYNNTNDYLNTNNSVNLYSNLDSAVTTFDETLNSITFNYGDDYNTNESNLIASLDLNGLETSFIDTKSLADLSIEQEFAYFDACYDAYVDKIQLMMEYNKAGLAANIDALYQVHTGSNYSANDDDAAFALYSAAISAIPSGASITSVQYLRHYHIDANGKVDGFTDPDHAPQTIISDTVVGGCYIDKGRIESDITTSTSSNPQPVDGGGGYTYTPDV